MRETEFRGKRVDTGEWVYGDLVQGEYIFDKSTPFCNSKGEYSFNFKRVDPKTVGQYMGLKYKDGTKIFEGDILEWMDEGVIGYTVYDCFGIPCILSKDDLQFKTFEESLKELGNGNLRKAGNVHDNPDFLKGANNA
jgi:uncharacterized phage protein (TIGR01671 family)